MQAIAESELPTELQRRGFLDEQRVRSGIDEKVIDALRENHAACPLTAFDDQGAPASLQQLPRSGESGNTGADDYNFWRSVHVGSFTCVPSRTFLHRGSPRFLRRTCFTRFTQVPSRTFLHNVHGGSSTYVRSQRLRWFVDRALVDEACERLDVLERSGGQDAVSQIEDMSRAACRTPQDICRALEQPIARSEQQRRIEVPLHRAVGADALPRLVQWNPPIGAEDIATGLTHVAKNRARVDAEMNGRHRR